MRKWSLVVVAILLSGGCLREPTGPTKWDIQLATPLIRDSVLFEDLDINIDSSLFDVGYDSLGILSVSFSDSIPPETLENIIDLPEVHDTFSVNLSDVMVIDLDTSSTSISLIDIVPSSIAPLIPDSGYAIIPPFANTI